MKEIKTLGFFYTRENVIPPAFATEGSACFDICACLTGVHSIKCYDSYQHEFNVPKELELYLNNDTVTLNQGVRAMIPTGIIFDIPIGFSVRVHSRSGLSLKNGVVLVNQEGVIDSDYVQETFVLLENKSNYPFEIKHGMRICQGELVENVPTRLQVINEKPFMKTRTGGFGSTGVN